MNRLRAINDYIKREHTNLVKSAKRARSLQGIIEKGETLKDLICEYKSVLNKNKHTLSEKQWNDEVEIYQALKARFTECSKILDNTRISTPPKHSLKSVANSIIFCKRLSGNIKPWEHTPIKMTTFDIKTATALVQPYDGSDEGLDAFLDATSLLAEITSADLIPTAIKFLRTRLTGKARLGLPETFDTIDALKQNIKQRCASKTTPENVVAKLRAIRQRGSVESFCEEVDSLTAKLKAVYIEKGIPEQLANSMATKTGVETLINGTNSQDNKIILKAGTFSEIKEATQKLLENTNTNNQQTQVLSFNTRNTNSHIGQNQHARNYRGNHRNQNFNNKYSNYYTRNQSNNRLGGQFQQFRPQFNQPPQRRCNGYNSNRFQRGRSNFQTRHIYTANAQQAQPMQRPMLLDTPMARNHHQGLGVPTMPPGDSSMQPGGLMQNNAFLGYQGQYMTPQN